MMLDVTRLLFDFGLMVFFWMVQLVVYPCLLYFSKNELLNWYHKGKEKLWYIGLVLGPGQLFFSGIQIFLTPSVYTIGSFTIIIAVWTYNFTIMSTLHNKIMAGVDTSMEQRQKLIKGNWLRVVGSSAVFLWSLIYLCKKLYFF